MNKNEFDRLVERAVDNLPKPFTDLLANIVILVEDEPWPELANKRPDNIILGVYVGRGRAFQSSWAYGARPVEPDTIVLFQKNIEKAVTSPNEIAARIQEVLEHEIGHHFGLSDIEMYQ